MVLWLFGWFVQVKIHFKGLAEGGEMVFWCFGVFVFWLKAKIHFKGLACGFVRLVVSFFGWLVFSNRGGDDSRGSGVLGFRCPVSRSGGYSGLSVSGNPCRRSRMGFGGR